MSDALLGLILGVKSSVYFGVFIYASMLTRVLKLKEIYPLLFMSLAFLSIVVLEWFDFLNILAHETTYSLGGILIFAGGVCIAATLLLINKNIERYR